MDSTKEQVFNLEDISGGKTSKKTRLGSIKNTMASNGGAKKRRGSKKSKKGKSKRSRKQKTAPSQ